MATENHWKYLEILALQYGEKSSSRALREEELSENEETVTYWKENPFETYIILGERDVEKLVMLLERDYVQDSLADIYFNIEELGLDGVKKEIEEIREVYFDETHPKVIAAIKELKEPHCGDCVCIASSCYRCYVEGLLGLETISGDKHMNHSLLSAFSNGKTAKEALYYLKSHKFMRPDSWPSSINYEECIPRWEASQQKALVWLEKYLEKHNFN